MNRIKISPLATQPIDESKESFDLNLPGTSTAKKDFGFSLSSDKHVDSSDSCLFLPLHYEKNYEYPLIVWMHNNGDDAGHLHRVMPEFSIQNYVAVAPQAALGDVHCGFYWEQDNSSIDYAADAVLASIDMARTRANISTKRIYIGGFGAAGTMAFRVAFTHPDLFAGVASINGPLPEGETPLGRWSSSRHLEVFWSHCRNSEEFDQEQLCKQLKLLHIAGFSVTLRQYPGEDELTPSALKDLNRWIMEMSDSTIS